MANEKTVSGLTITCNSCAARLKVNKPSLIGQMLACPKCGTMLRIVPPAEEKPSPANTAVSNLGDSSSTHGEALASDPVKTTLTTSDFDEIEQLLIKNPELGNPLAHSDLQKFKTTPKTNKENSQSPVPASNQSATRPKSGGSPKTESNLTGSVSKSSESNNSNAPNARKGQADLDHSNSPLLPSSQWTSAAAQQRKKMMTLLAAAIGLILVLLTIVILLVNGAKNTSSDLVAKNDNTKQSIATTEAPDDSKKNAGGNPSLDPIQADHENDSRNANSEGSTSPASNSAHDPQAGVTSPADPDKAERPGVDDSNGDTGDPSDGLIDQPPPTVDPLDIAPPVMNDDPVSNELNPDQSNSLSAEKPPANDELPPFPKTDETSRVRPDDSNSPLSNLDRLSQMVAGSQLSVSRFRDLAANARDEQIVGLPKYFIERDDPPPVDVAEQLSIPLSQLRYDSVPLSSVARDLMTITGVPMTIDVESVIAHHGTANPKVQLDAQGGDFSQTLDTLLQSAKLIKLQPDRGRGLIFVAADREVFSEAKYDLPNIPTVSDDDRKAAIEELGLIVQGLIAPESWKLNENPARLTFADSTATVINTPVVHFQTRELFAKIAALQETPSNDAKEVVVDAKNGLGTKTMRIQEKLNSPSGLSHRFPETLVDTLDRLSAKSDIIILADWEALSTMGWGPLTKIPGTLFGTTLRESLKELTQALSITYVIINDQTILLTSFEASVLHTDLEVYSFKKLLNGKITEEQALTLLTQTLAPELNNPRIRSYYSKRHQSLFVVAPQILQRKIENIVQALEKM